MNRESPTTDRELLELAAKAAWMNMVNLRWYGTPIPRFYYLHDGDPTMHTWNPLTDDGDAFRLAVKLGLIVNAPTYSTTPAIVQFFDIEVEQEVENRDILSATRRAIVRAAAEIGKTMP